MESVSQDSMMHIMFKDEEVHNRLKECKHIYKTIERTYLKGWLKEGRYFWRVRKSSQL